MDYNPNLPATDDQLARNIETALTTIGSGGGMPGAQFMRIDFATGACTCGRDRTPVPLQHRYAAPLALIRHGFKVWENGAVTAEVMEPIASSPTLPVPKTPYVGYRQNGPRKAMEVVFLDLDEPGFNLCYGILAVSAENAVKRMLLDGLTQIRGGHADFANPVIYIRPECINYRKFSTTGWTFGHQLVDFISNDGSTLWSQSKTVTDAAELPWETGQADGPGERL